MSILKPTPVVLCLALVLAGCGHSPPTRFYTLDALPPATSPAYAGPALRIGQVYVPAVLDRSELVQEMTAGQLKVADFDHWGAPLGQLIRSALESDLNGRVPAGKLLPDTGPVPDGGATIMVTVLAVNRTNDGLSMDVTWTRTVTPKPNHPTTTTQSLRLTSDPVDASAQGYASGLSQMAARLADAIVAS